jgi:uncharacterized protein YheU (UPF0270 family)
MTAVDHHHPAVDGTDRNVLETSLTQRKWLTSSKLVKLKALVVFERRKYSAL